MHYKYTLHSKPNSLCIYRLLTFIAKKEPINLATVIFPNKLLFRLICTDQSISKVTSIFNSLLSLPLCGLPTLSSLEQKAPIQSRQRIIIGVSKSFTNYKPLLESTNNQQVLEQIPQTRQLSLLLLIETFHGRKLFVGPK